MGVEMTRLTGAAQMLPIVVPSPLVGEGNSAGGQKYARVRDLLPEANIIPLELAGVHPSFVAGFARATCSHKGRRKEPASANLTIGSKLADGL
jgi:hypothetical protein